MIDMDTVFDTLNELFIEINGYMARTGGELLDWAVNAKLITDDQRDFYYAEGGI